MLLVSRLTMMEQAPPLQQSTNAVADAALAMVRASTDATTRAEASQFLEQWTRTTEAWDVYVSWLQSFSVVQQDQIAQQELIGMKLLCLTLLQAKIRREIPKGTAEFPALARIRQELWSLLLLCSAGSGINPRTSTTTIMAPLCVCTAALVARCGNVNQVVTMCCHVGVNQNGGGPSTSLSTLVALKLLASIPSELEACSDLTTPAAELCPSMESVLVYVQCSFINPDKVLAALETLHVWSQTCHVTLSHLASINGGGQTLLSMLIRILSSTHPTSEEIITTACRALAEAALVPTDSCTPSRQNAMSQLLSAIETTGFIGNPLKYSTERQWDDACHALSMCLCTLVGEDIDYVTLQPAEALLTLLVNLQSHPSVPVTLPVLECWLTVQEIPTSVRHLNWTKSLFRQVIQGLVSRVAYPIDGELDDETEFNELRNMVTDVLVSSYFLLRTEYLQHMIELIVGPQPQQPWNAVEAALFGLHQVSKEVCARVKARAGGDSIRSDKQASARVLSQLAHHLIQHESSSTHFLVEKATARFLGSYAPAWNAHCAPGDILHLVAHLQRKHGTSSNEETAKAIRSIYIACSSRLLEGPQPFLVASVQDTMAATLSSVASGNGTIESVSAQTEGVTRLLLQMQDTELVQQALSHLISSVVSLSECPVQTVSSSSVVESNAAIEALLKYLHILRTSIQFCDQASTDTSATDATPGAHLLSDVASATLWPFLDRVGRLARLCDVILEGVLAIHRQLLSNARTLVEPRFSETIKMVVVSLEETKNPSTLEYLSSAVESFSGTEESSFRELLLHVTNVVCTYVTTENGPDECPELSRAFLELNQRYLLFQPMALVTCRDFSMIVAFAVESLSACKGEPLSTRASLNFLAQLFGWRSLRLSDTSMTALNNAAGTIDELLVQCGETVVQACIAGLAGDSPQILWPSLSDCLFAIVAHIATASVVGPVVEERTIAHEWVHDAMSSSCRNGGRITPDASQQIISILFGLAREGPKSKPRAKMLLTDFAKICNGDMAFDALLTYSLS